MGNADRGGQGAGGPAGSGGGFCFESGDDTAGGGDEIRSLSANVSGRVEAVPVVVAGDSSGPGLVLSDVAETGGGAANGFVREGDDGAVVGAENGFVLFPPVSDGMPNKLAPRSSCL